MEKITKVDDIDGTPADATVQFALEGKTFEIDLSETNAALLREQIGEWAKNARPAVKAKANKLPAAKVAAIRAWAATNGFELAERGRIPKEVVAAYDAA